MQKTSSSFLIRRLGPKDEQLLLEFFRSHTRDTLYQRYAYIPTGMSQKKASELVNVDQEKNVALGLFELSSSGERLDSVARYCTEADGKTGEMAIVVREAMRRRGIASALLHDLAGIAEKNGLTHFRAQVLRDNPAMHLLLDRYAPKICPTAGVDAVEYLVSVRDIQSRRGPEAIGGINRSLISHRADKT